ncbi:MAG: hypothetical protein OEY77_03900 [Nitrospira sp.]|nr:hypothetical protein [Nitrospira sp.]
MIKPIIILLILLLTQSGCSVFGGYTNENFQPSSPSEMRRQEHERLKREFLQIEDLKIGRGPLAAFGRKITADVVIRYASDGSLAYEGPVLTYVGIRGAPFIHNSLRAPGLLSLVSQPGILLGLNGMAAGGKRRFTIAPKLVCGWDGPNEPRPSNTCKLATGSKDIVKVRIAALQVEATLTGACAPLSLVGRRSEDTCRDFDEPKREPGDPIWRMYYAEPLPPRGSQ